MHDTLVALVASAPATLAACAVFRFLDGPLYEPVRGGTPRGVGVVPALIYAYLAPLTYGVPVVTHAVLGFVDDALGRTHTRFGVEVGHLARGTAMLLAFGWCWWRFHPITGLVTGFLPQPANIVDMQPRAFTFAALTATVATIPWWNHTLVSVAWAALVPYVLLDLKGRTMLGDAGNASVATALLLACTRGDPIGAVAFLTSFTLAGAFYRFKVEPRLREYMEDRLGIEDPTFMDAVWDVLTGGALMDLIKVKTFGRTEVPECSRLARLLGYRRLVLIGRSTVGERVWR
ncbi:hypothetical protein [Methanopyrus sp. SNP6]|uniref:hypothetical protein n=1 Tax=Methanopyrus sp. SNP6 TaxID=1937005 RepID=UPI0011E5EC1B|nr:hypothetical protein [Methanopyrus sp. SNP6]